MAAVVSWYGPLIDLSAAASHVGGFVQLLAAVRRVRPHQVTSKSYIHPCSSGYLVSDIKIVEFRNGLEGRASQISAVQVLLNSKDLMNPEGIGELITICKVGNATKSKLRRVAEWSLRAKCALGESRQQIYVFDQSGQVPLLVRNKAAEILFANIIADDVSECYKSHMLLETYVKSGNLSASGTIDDAGNKEITKRRKTEQKPNFHQIWLIMIKCLLNQSSNSPFCFQILVNPEKNIEDGRFELVSLTIPIP
ncbi:hypothetical protein BAE44_0017169 [Dichanthelium oligosanthes]|uniref:Uncharacterized protein n=1 Tax=Dichanthelium oligosanthes TaxID=888268 RepID=A0A1E5V9M7_9POAL|nr:hypothetical protein BAE44_0017169 [Dichanthelium oligosanthes]